nr:hypothetical protein [Tanacetum cinerariifolium]
MLHDTGFLILTVLLCYYKRHRGQKYSGTVFIEPVTHLIEPRTDLINMERPPIDDELIFHLDNLLLNRDITASHAFILDMQEPTGRPRSSKAKNGDEKFHEDNDSKTNKEPVDKED